MRVVPLESPGTKSISIAAASGANTMIESQGRFMMSPISASHRAIENKEQNAHNHRHCIVLSTPSL